MSMTNTVHCIQSRPRGMLRYPMGRWVVVFSNNRAPIWCDTLNEAKEVAEREGGVRKWQREQRDGYVAYWPKTGAE